MLSAFNSGFTGKISHGRHSIFISHVGPVLILAENYFGFILVHSKEPSAPPILIDTVVAFHSLCGGGGGEGGVIVVQSWTIETWELLHQKQSKFAFSEPPLVDDIINIINQSRTRKSLWPVVQHCLHFG